MHSHVLRLVLIAKMVTMLGEYITKEQHSDVHFSWVEGHNTKDIQPVYDGKCLLSKVVFFCLFTSTVTPDLQRILQQFVKILLLLYLLKCTLVNKQSFVLALSPVQLPTHQSNSHHDV